MHTVLQRMSHPGLHQLTRAVNIHPTWSLRRTRATLHRVSHSALYARSRLYSLDLGHDAWVVLDGHFVLDVSFTSSFFNYDDKSEVFGCVTNDLVTGNW